MRKRDTKTSSLQGRLIFYVLTIVALSSFFAFGVIANILPVTSELFAALDAGTKVNALQIFRVYNLLAMGFAFVLSALFIAFSINKMLKPVRALTEGTKKVACGDFDVVIPTGGNKQTELNILTDSFNKMARELSLINMLNNDFVNNVSHEFKTPISSIQGFATVMLGTELTDEQKEYAEIIVDESDRLTRLITNILKLTKLENQVIITEQEEFRLDEQIRHSILLLQSEWTQKKIEMNVELSQISCIANAELTQQIWYNLLSNAIKFSYENGQIDVSCYDDGSNTVVSIKDYGIGMDKITRTHAFDKFYQGDKSHSGDGNGLGLSLVNRIVDLCKGTIDVRSELGKGSEFIVILPSL
jgi:signal transduction histidine kinase